MQFPLPQLLFYKERGANTLSQKPVYESQGKLLIKQNGASSLTGLSDKVGALSGLANTSSPLETEAELIRSNPIVERTINALDLKDKKGKPLKVEVVPILLG